MRDAGSALDLEALKSAPSDRGGAPGGDFVTERSPDRFLRRGRRVERSTNDRHAIGDHRYVMSHQADHRAGR
jgi:hypothetical protein